MFSFWGACARPCRPGHDQSPNSWVDLLAMSLINFASRHQHCHSPPQPHSTMLRLHYLWLLVSWLCLTLGTICGHSQSLIQFLPPSLQHSFPLHLKLKLSLNCRHCRTIFAFLPIFSLLRRHFWPYANASMFCYLHNYLQSEKWSS